MEHITKAKLVFMGLALTGLVSFKISRNEKQQYPRQSERPNIIFILTDDQRFDALGAMGNRIIQTPHMDKLAKGGILFCISALFFRQPAYPKRRRACNQKV